MEDLVFVILPSTIAATWFIITVILLICHAIYAANGYKLDLRRWNGGLYLAFGLFPITSVFGFHIPFMCTSLGAKIFHLALRFLLMVFIGLMAATMKCPVGSSCAVAPGVVFIVPSLILLVAIYLFTAIEAIIAFTKAQK